MDNLQKALRMRENAKNIPSYREPTDWVGIGLKMGCFGCLIIGGYFMGRGHAKWKYNQNIKNPEILEKKVTNDLKDINDIDKIGFIRREK